MVAFFLWGGRRFGISLQVFPPGKAEFSFAELPSVGSNSVFNTIEFEIQFF
jgi:hypothetical protein